jgi:predicted amidohydrolase YtcJ
MYPINSLLRNGCLLSAGSDWTVSSLNPLDAIEVAVTRKGLSDDASTMKDEPLNLDERVNLLDILAAYTCGGAFVDHTDRETGTLEVGKSADLVVLDKNLFEVRAEEIHKARVMQTLIEGEIVFDRERDLVPTSGAKN